MSRILLFLLVVAGVHAQTLQPSPTFEVLIRNGTVFDGTGGRPFTADVGIVGRHIARVGSLAGARAEIELDASGLYVAPGFINIHSHASAEGLPTAENMLTQGVTTEILNPDGGGPVSVAEQLARLSASELAVNVGAYIGFNRAWSTVIGAENRRPSADEVERMREIIETGLKDGAWGVSSGLDYKPAYFAQLEDVISIVSVAAPWRTNFTNHDRLTPESNYSSRAGVAETIAVGSRAGLLPVVTHMKAQGLEQGAAPGILKMMQAGSYTAADAYPYLAGQSGLGALIIPGWAQEGGREAMLRRFADPAQRARIVPESEQAMKARFGGPEGVYVTTIERELTGVMREQGVTAGEAVVRLLETREMGAILRFGAEADLVAILQHPATSIACDCGATPGRATHPRYYGSYPRVLGRYVRETKALTWEDAIRKMTGLPASTIGMVDRGFLAPGMAADVTVFDPSTVIDRATFENPMLPSEGIRHVLVNGRVALRDGKATGEHAGMALRRSEHMPSRAMQVAGTRRVSASGAGLVLDIRHERGAPRARGSLRLVDPRTGQRIESTSLGVLQVAAGWASVTGWARISPAGDERAVTLIVDAGASRDEQAIVHVDGLDPLIVRLDRTRITGVRPLRTNTSS